MPPPNPTRSSRREPTARFSPAPGCVILSIGSLLVLAGVIWAVYTFSRQLREIGKFTSPDPVPIRTLPPDPAALAAVNARLTAFKNAVDAGEGPTLTLNVDELNTLLGNSGRLESVKPFLSIERIDGSSLVAQVSLPMNTLPGRRAYLNGAIHFHPAAHPKAGLHLATDEIIVPGKTVPPGFLDIYQRGVLPGKSFGFLDDMLVRSFRTDRDLGPYFRKIQSASVTPDGVTVTASPGPPAQADE